MKQFHLSIAVIIVTNYVYLSYFYYILIFYHLFLSTNQLTRFLLRPLSPTSIGFFTCTCGTRGVGDGGAQGLQPLQPEKLGGGAQPPQLFMEIIEVIFAKYKMTTF